MIVFAVSQLRSYYDCGEQYFGTEGIFLTYDEAKEFINVTSKVFETIQHENDIKISKILSRSRTICSTTISAIFRLTP